jgi:hypothetical protein
MRMRRVSTPSSRFRWAGELAHEEWGSPERLGRLGRLDRYDGGK